MTTIDPSPTTDPSAADTTAAAAPRATSAAKRAQDRPGLAADDPRLTTWRAFLESHARVSRRLDEELRAEHGLSLGEYEALLRLAGAPGRRLRMNVLADRVILSRSGITRLIDRLVAGGLVAREHCSSDARGAEAVLTRAGLTRLRAAADTHLRGIEDHFLSAMTVEETEEVGRSLAKVARRASLGEPEPVCESPVPAEPTSA